MVVYDWIAPWLVTMILISSLWAASHLIGFISLGLTLYLIVLVGFVPYRDSEVTTPLRRPERNGILIGLLAAFPIITFLVLTWRQDFPFIGDHDYHLAKSLEALNFWGVRFVPSLLLVSMLWWSRSRPRGRRWVAPLIFALLATLGWLNTEPVTFAVRYPGSFYFLAIPFVSLWRLLGADDPLNALRLTNALAVPVWLFVLRPLLLRRWPDSAALLFSIYFFFQKDVVYYFTSSYLEPWALILILLAVEHLVIFGPRRGWLVYLLIGSAAMFKEQAILMLPFAVVASWSGGPRRAQALDLFRAVLAATPFVLYFLVRQEANVWRKAGLASWSEVTAPDRVAVFMGRAWIQFGPSLILVVLSLMLTVWLATRKHSRRRVFASLLGGALLQVAFFYTDRISLAWTGYPRFHLLPLVIIGAPWMYIAHALNERQMKKSATLSLAILMALLNSVPLATLFSSSQVDQDRNFVEHYESPVYLPIRRLIAAGDAKTMLGGRDSLTVLSNIYLVEPSYQLGAIPLAYPGLSRRFQIRAGPVGVDVEEECRCRDESDIRLVTYLFFTNLRASEQLSRISDRQAAACNALLDQTCGDVSKLSLQGHSLGAIAAGVRRK